MENEAICTFIGLISFFRMSCNCSRNFCWSCEWRLWQREIVSQLFYMFMSCLLSFFSWKKCLVRGWRSQRMSNPDFPARVLEQWKINFNTARGFAECGIENFDFIVVKQVKVNLDNSRSVSVLRFLLFKLNSYTAQRNTVLQPQLNQPKPWSNGSDVLNLHHGYYTTPR